MTKQTKVSGPAPITMRLWPDAGKSLGIGRSATYAAAARGEIPTVRIGNTLLVPIKPFEKKFGGAE